MTPRGTILVGDALATLATLATDSVDAVVTSPPYLQARNYDAGPSELGQEDHVDAWVQNLREVSREIARVLVPTGSYWLNVGDLYSRHHRFGAAPKSLLLAPERLVRALQSDGWIVRNRVAWVKTTPMPSPIADRLTNTWEYVFHLVRQPHYTYDLDAIRVPLVSGPRRRSRSASVPPAALGRLAGPRSGLARMAREGRSGHPLGRNPGDMWLLPPGRARDNHRATFPAALVRRPILATCPLRVCTKCGRPWRRSRRKVRYLAGRPQPRPLEPCGCEAPTRPGLVLDPFMGSGTTGEVARDLGRDWLGIELNPAFAASSERRIRAAGTSQ